MKKIQVKYTTYSDSMGDGWDDESAANEAYSDYATGQIEYLLTENYPDTEVAVSVIPCDGSGHSTLYVETDSDDNDAIDIEDLIRAHLDDFWSGFCGSDEAAEL